MATKTKSTLDPGVAKTIQAIENAVPGVKIFNLGCENPGLDINRNSAGSFKLDQIMGGGLPEGRIIELYGPESSGKTSLNLIMAGEYTRNKKNVLFIDAEHAFDVSYAEKLGVDPQYINVTQPDYGEQAFAVLENAIKSGQFDFIVVDSVAALTPKVLLEADIENNAKIGALAALMSRGLQRIVATVSNSKATVSFINQTRVKIGGFAPGMGTPMDTTGGKALKFYSSIRIDVRKGQDIKRKDRKIGQEMKVRTIKNKTFPPFRETLMTLMLDDENDNWGVSAASEIFDMIIEKDILGTRGRFVSLRGVPVKGEGGVPGKDKLREYLEANRDEFDYLIAQAKAGTMKPVEELRREDGSIEGFDPIVEKVESNDHLISKDEPLMSSIDEFAVDLPEVTGGIDLVPQKEEEGINLVPQKEEGIDLAPVANAQADTILTGLLEGGEKVEPKTLVDAVKEEGGKITWADAKALIKSKK